MKIHKKPSFRLALWGAALSMPGIVGAVDITTAFGNGADTYLTNDSNSGPTANHGTETGMEIRHLAGARLRVLYLRFDLSGVSGDLSGATLTLNGTTINRNRPLNFRGLLDGTTTGQGENWDETTISYSDAAGLDPAAALGAYAYSADATPSWIAHTTGSAVGLNTTSVSGDLDNFLAADTDGLVTFIVALEEVVNGSEDFFFETKEAGGAAPPTLSLPNATAGDSDADGLADAWE